MIVSPYEELKQHRNAVIETLQRIGSNTIAMELFGATAERPIDVCLQNVVDADNIIVVLGHSYGFIPPRDAQDLRMGDGERSITHLEIDEAIRLNKPLFAFFLRETDTPDDHVILGSIKNADTTTAGAEPHSSRKKLAALKKQLQDTVTCDWFTSADDLAGRVATALFNRLYYERAQPEFSASHSYRIAHTLPRPQPFIGRAEERGQIDDWHGQTDLSTPIVEIIAAGGFGKSSLVGNWLHENDRLLRESPGSKLVWSFYAQPDPEIFLRACADLFLGKTEADAAWRLNAIKRHLGNGEPHFLFLDGLDAMYVSDHRARALGEVEHKEISELLCSILEGLGGTRTLLTSRHPVQFGDRLVPERLLTIRLAPFSASEQIDFLKGHNSPLVRENMSILEEIGGHPLSLSVLASLSEITRDLSLSLSDIDEGNLSEPEAAKLSRILHTYALELTEEERNLLSLIASFPSFFPIWRNRDSAYEQNHLRGITSAVEIDPEVERKFQLAARSLELRGLVYRTEVGDASCVTAHPFLRQYFRPLLGMTQQQVDEYLRQRADMSLILKSRQGHRGNDFLLEQLSLPEEPWVAPYTAWWLNLENADMISLAIQALGAKDGSVVMDIGFGGAVSFSLIPRAIPKAKVIRIEASHAMIDCASQTFRAQLSSGDISIIRCVVGEERLDVRSNSVDNVVCVNTVYFVTDPVNVFRAALRILKPGGKFVLANEPAGMLETFGFDQAGFFVEGEAQSVAWLAEAGFKNIQVLTPSSRGAKVDLIIGGKIGGRWSNAMFENWRTSRSR